MRTSKFVPRFAALCLAATASAAYAQNAIQLFSPVNNRYSISGTSESNPNDFQQHDTEPNLHFADLGEAVFDPGRHGKCAGRQLYHRQYRTRRTERLHRRGKRSAAELLQLQLV